MGRAPCCSKVGLHRGPWTPKEDSLLTNYIQTHGEGQWRSMPKNAGLLRCGKSCRLRWMNYLRPDIKRGNINPDEDDLIIRLHALLGNRWSLIAGRLPGRTDNEIKNYWNTHLSKKLLSQGIDPNTHKKIPEQNPNPNPNPNPPKPNKPKKKRAPPRNTTTKAKKQEKGYYKVHLPKPVRVTSTALTSLTRNDSNASFQSNLTTASPSTSEARIYTWPPYDQRAGDVRFLIGCEEEDDVADLVVREHGVMVDSRASDLDKLYEEYLQLIKADGGDDGIVLDLDDEARELDSFAESLLI